jgi:hypothetical protein
MKAVLVGGIGSDKLYYVIDADTKEKDGVLEKSDGKTVNVDFMGFVSSCRGLRKIRTSRFHRSLWDSPKNPTKGSWYETFVSKTKPVNEKSLDGAVVVTSIGSNKKKIKAKNDAVTRFMQTKTAENSRGHGCFDEMVKFDNKDYVFKTEAERKQAWSAIAIMRQLEGLNMEDNNVNRI